MQIINLDMSFIGDAEKRQSAFIYVVTYWNIVQ